MRRPFRFALAVAALACLLGVAPARAAGAQAAAGPAVGAPVTRHSVSYSLWTISGSAVRLRFILPSAETRTLVPPGPTTTSVAGTAIASQVSVSSPSGECTVIDQGEGVGQVYTLALMSGLDRFEMIFDCPQAGGLVLNDHVLFERVPDHVNFARIQVDGAPPVLQIFTRDHQSLAAEPAKGRLGDAGLLRLAKLGMSRLLAHPDRLLLLVGLLLLTRRWRDLGVIAGAFGLGYLASLIVALSGLLAVEPRLADAVVGLLPALIGVSVLRLETAGAPSRGGWRIAAVAGAVLICAGFLAAATLRGVSVGLAAAGLAVFSLVQMWIVGAQPRFRWLVFAPAALFGLLDGMGLPGDIAALQLPPGRLPLVFLGYDLGVVATALGLIAAAFALLWLLRRWLKSLRNIAAEFAAAGLIGLGLFWFVSQLYSL